MAVSSKESKANIQNLLGLGLSQEQLGSESYGDKMNPNEMNAIIQKYGLSKPSSLSTAINSSQPANQALATTANGVATRTTVSDLLSQFGGSGDLGNLAAPVFNFEQAYKELLESNGVAPLETRLNQLKTDEQTTYDQFMTNKRAEESKSGLVPINVVEGRIGEQGKNTQNLLDTITREKSSVTDELNTKYNTINQLMTFKNMNYQVARDLYDEVKGAQERIENFQVQYADAGISLTDSFDIIASKIAASEDKSTIKQLKTQYPTAKITSSMSFDEAIDAIGKNMEKSDLEDAYKAIYGSKPKGLSSNEIKKKIEKYYKSEKTYQDKKRALELQEAELSIAKSKKSLSDSSIPLSPIGIDWSNLEDVNTYQNILDTGGGLMGISQLYLNQ
ncbi:MAG: hypothetical protein ABIC19_00580 [Patescibacteria group bacterium]|nr:hypothetical protein [Patescibacteria group bacterium]